MTYQTSVSNANRALKRDADGNWTALSTGMSTNSVKGYKRLPDGTYLVYGDFGAAGGVANTAGLALYNPLTNAFTSVATFAGTATVNDVSIAPNGHAVAVGAFTGVNAVANTGRIALRNFATGVWTSLANPSATNTLTAVHYANDGQIYVGGVATFTIGGTGATDSARRDTAGTWAAMTGMAVVDEVLDIAASLDGTIYFSFNIDGIYRVSGTTLTNISPVGAPSATSLLFTQDGRMYVALANSDTIGGVDVNYAGYWNGVTFYPLAGGFNNNALKVAYSAQDQIIYYAGTYTTADGIALLDPLSGWNGSAHIPVDIDLPGSANVYDIYAPAPDYLFLGFSTGGTAIAAGVNTISNPGTSNTYPVVTVFGPGRLLQLKNYTTGRAVYFDITLLAGEVVTLDFASAKGATFTSNFRGDVMGYALAGSNLDLFLKSGSNSISLFVVADTPGTTSAQLVFRPRYSTISDWALDRIS